MSSQGEQTAHLDKITIERSAEGVFPRFQYSISALMTDD